MSATPPPPPNFVNQTIWTGDNLPIMRGMNTGSVDMIYLDPPFNSDANYAAPIGSKAAGAAFRDTWTLKDVDVAWLDLIDAKHPRLNRVIHAAMTGSDKSYLIYMAVRLLEMKRILKPTGSIYLHCDPTMSHYLKLVMDAVFGKGNFRNEITWQRYGSHNDASRFGRVTDIILFYAGKGAKWNSIRIPLSESDIKTRYKNEDARGKYTTSPLHARTLSGGGYNYTWKGISDVWKFPKKRLNQLEKEGRIHWPKRGSVPRRKVYLEDNPGKPLSCLWTDISRASGRELTGYPTQKPKELVQRMIAASTDEGDIVLDPFCGCATACIAAQELHRQWVGIDISPKAASLVLSRLKDELGIFAHKTVAHRMDIPHRTDIGQLLSYNDAKNKRLLYGEQGGYCNACETHFKLRNLTVDHIIPRSKGGTDHIDNLQLLCGHCNSVKGDRGMEYLKAKLAA